MKDPTAMNFALLGGGIFSAAVVPRPERHANLKIVGACDRDPTPARIPGDLAPTRTFRDRDEILASDAVDAIFHRPKPRDSVATTRRFRGAGKHLEAIKPGGMDVAEAGRPLDLAQAKGPTVATAPGRVLSPVGRRRGQAVDGGPIGRARRVHAHFEEGMIASFDAPRAWPNPRFRPPSLSSSPVGSHE